ncbi:hypothetical protein [Prosthecobacter sp.]|uniref:hypothetical protein n=1 Tax=Prosthecobacter sp. TaxID=1965333 RepID=UPI003784885E
MPTKTTLPLTLKKSKASAAGIKLPLMMKRAKDTPPEAKAPLSEDERQKLRELMDDAHNSNIALVNTGGDVERARVELAAAQKNLEHAERTLKTARQWNSDAHAAIAPLLHRLPVC